MHHRFVQSIIRRSPEKRPRSFLALRLTGWISLFAFLALPLAATANPIGPNCPTCQGSVYSISYDGSPISTTATTETFRITLSIDTSGYSGGGSFLDTVSLKVSSMLVSATLFEAPGGVGAWAEVMGGLNANGCSGSGSGFDCAGANSSGVGVPNGSAYDWVFDLEMSTGSLFTGTGESSIKARYVDSQGGKVGDLVSEPITLMLIPEPATGLLVALGCMALGMRNRR